MSVLNALQDSVIEQLDDKVQRAMAGLILQRALDDDDNDRADEVDKIRSRQEADRAVDELDVSELDNLRPVARKAFQTAGEIGMAEAVAMVKIAVPKADDFTLPNDQIVDYAQNRSAELVGKRVLEDGTVIDNPNRAYAITDTTRDMLRYTITKAFEERWTRPQLRDALEENFAFSRARAETISRTEISNALLDANQQTVRATGLDATKESLLGSEHDDDDECDQAAQDGPIPLKQAFSNGMMGPTYHPKCVCDLVYAFTEPTE